MATPKLLMALPLAALIAFALAQAPARAAGQEGMVVVRDPQTGELRAPTAAERQALTGGPKASLRAMAPLASQAVRNPDGGLRLHLGERGLTYEVVKRGPDGQLTQQCVRGEQAASRALARPATREARDEDR